MKKILSTLLALALLALCCAGYAEAVEAAPIAPVAPAAPAAPDMPEVGGVVHGFELTEVRDYSLIGGTIYRFVHQRTWAELFYIANSDTNRSFMIGFHTQPIDQTGLPHVFEHATLDGSDKYPSKALWFNLANGSYHTFMNAMTDINSTIYPIASLSEAQLLKLADLYVDSCFHPMLMKDESIYREEAWRYRLGSMDDDLTIEGTVYSEMLGARTLEHTAYFNLLNLALPGAYCNNDSGGVPEFIPDMSYEDLKSYHERYYHPSNSVSYLYGKLDDYGAFLQLLDDEFSAYEPREFSFDEPGYAPIAAPVEATFDFPMEATSDTDDASAVYFAIVCPGLKDDPETLLTMNTLASLMNDTASNIHQAFERAFPRANFGFEFSDEGPERLFLAAFQHVNPEDVDTLRGLLEDGLKDIAENGFAREMIDASMASLEISSRLTAEVENLGVNLSNSFMSSYVTTGDPWFNLEWVEALNHIAEWNEDGTYARLIDTWLLGSELTATAVTRPVPGLKEQNDAALAERLAGVKAGMSEDELSAIIETTNAEDEDDPDTARLLDALTAVTVESLPEEVQDYPMTDETGADGVRRIDVTADVDGIGSVSLLFDASGLTQDQLRWFKLYTSLLGSMDTAEHDYQALDTLINRYLYDFSAGISGDPADAALRLKLSVEWISLDDDLAPAYDLVREVLFETSFEDTQRLLEQVQGLRTSLKSSITGAPYSTLVRRGMGRFVPFYRLSDYASGLGYYEFLTALETELEENPQAAVAQLEAVQRYFDNRANLILGYAGSAEGIEVNRPLADAFAGALDSREIVPQEYDLPSPDADREALIVDSAVQYNGITMGLDSLGMAEDYDARIEVVNALIEDLYLYPQLRDRYGAYGVGMNTISEVGQYVYSYRDPTVAEAFAVLKGIPEFLETLETDQATVDRYILSCYTGYATPDGALTGASGKLGAHVLGHEPEEVLEEMRALKSVTPETLSEFVDFYRTFVTEGYRFTGGGATAVNQNAALYDNILNPFGAVDKSQQALTDVDEGSEYYEAVRDVFENGLMGALEDGSFGVDAPASQGDLAAALMSIIGQPAEPAEAFAAMVDYGIMDGTASPEDALTAGACENVLGIFTGAIGLDYPGGITVEAEPFTRVDLAVTLSGYAQWLEGLEEAA